MLNRWVKKIEFKNKSNNLTGDKKYSQIIENLWKDFKQLFDKKIELNSNFSFSEMVIEIRELLGEGKDVAASIIKNFYQRKTNPRRKMIEARLRRRRRKWWRGKMKKIIKITKI